MHRDKQLQKWRRTRIKLTKPEVGFACSGEVVELAPLWFLKSMSPFILSSDILESNELFNCCL